MSDTVPLHVSKAAEEPVRRIEVFTGTGRRRNWSVDEKARIVAESYSSADMVCGVARRHGLTHSQLFAWRRQARHAPVSARETPHFVPAIVEGSLPESPSVPARHMRHSSGVIEVKLDGVTVRVGRGAEERTITAVIRALKDGA
jgi:transposase